jgi:hypothetical protein
LAEAKECSGSSFALLVFSFIFAVGKEHLLFTYRLFHCKSHFLFEAQLHIVSSLTDNHNPQLLTNIKTGFPHLNHTG